MQKGFFAVILLICVIEINTGIFCQSLCLIGHNDMAHHASRDAMSKQETKAEVCPITHSSNHSKHRQSSHTAPETFIKCDCSSQLQASLDYDIILVPPVDLTPYLQNISTVPPQMTTLISSEPILLERPPEILI